MILIHKNNMAVKSIEFCCDKLSHAYGTTVFPRSSALAEVWLGVYMNNTQIYHCPFCGTKIEPKGENQ